MTKRYTLNELLIIAVAREINNYDNVILGIGLPTTAGALAKALHAPQANLMMEAGMIDFEPLIPPNHIADVMACKGYACSTDLFTESDRSGRRCAGPPARSDTPDQGTRFR